MKRNRDVLKRDKKEIQNIVDTAAEGTFAVSVRCAHSYERLFECIVQYEHGQFFEQCLQRTDPNSKIGLERGFGYREREDRQTGPRLTLDQALQKEK